MVIVSALIHLVLTAEIVGAKDGFADGFLDGDVVGAAVNVVGAAVGGFDGAVVGGFDGAAVGALVGGFDGVAAVGTVVGALLRHVSGRDSSVTFSQADGLSLQQSFMPPEIVLASAAPRQALSALHAFLMPPISPPSDAALLHASSPSQESKMSPILPLYAAA